MKNTNYLLLIALCIGLTFLAGCKDDDEPVLENEEEVIDLVRLTFTTTGSTPLVLEATDADGEGPGDFSIPQISLAPNTTYELTIEIENTIAGENITTEIEEESDEHQFYFSWTSGIFSDPTGNGNMDNRDDDVNYNDKDINDLPVGLSTTWTTGESTSGATFRTVLKHQPDVKSNTSTFNDGETDIDLSWDLTIQ